MSEIIKHNVPIPKRSWAQRLLAFGIIVAILGAGGLVARHLLHSKPRAHRQAPGKMVTPVRAMPLTLSDPQVTIKAYGRVSASREVALKAQVSGEVVYINPKLEPGGVVAAGETLVRLDDADYKLALRRKKNTLAKVQADLRIEQGRQAVALKEWKLINELTSDIDKSSEDLALRRPQLAQVRAAIDGAKADVAKAELDLRRTVVKAPFRAVVLEKRVSRGSQVGPQTIIASLAGVDTFWAELSLPMSQVSWLHLPADGQPGPEITVVSSEKVHYLGRLLRLLPDLDPDGLMARVLVEIDDPMGLKDGGPPLPLGSFVSAEIGGKRITNCCRVPTSALRDGDRLFFIDDDNALEITPVSVLWSDAEWSFIDGEHSRPGARIIVSKIPAPIAGMPLKVVPAGAKP